MDRRDLTFPEAVEAFLKRTGMPISRFGSDACGDRSFIADLRAGREPRAATRQKVEQFMASYRVPGAGTKDEGRAAACTSVVPPLKRRA